MYRGWYKGVPEVRQRRRALGVLRRRVELAVPRRPGLPDQRGGEEEPPLGGRAVPRRPALASLGLPLPGRLAGVRRSSTTIIGTYLADNWRAFRTWGVSAISPWEHDFFWSLRDGVDKSRKQLKVDWENLAAPGLQPGLPRRAVRTHGPGLRAVATGSRRPTGRPSCATTSRCWPTSPASPRPSPARTTTSIRAKPSRSNSSSSTTRAQTVDGRLPLVARRCRRPWPARGQSTVATGQQERIPLRVRRCRPAWRRARMNLSATCRLQQRRDCRRIRSHST